MAQSKLATNSPLIEEAMTDSIHVCRRCMGSNTATAFCFTCVQPLCWVCKLRHDQNQRNKDHVTVDVNIHNIQALLCRDHKEFIEDYCVQCKSVCCGVCHTSTHKGHECQEFTSAYQELDGLIQRLMANNQTLLDYHEELRTMLSMDDKRNHEKINAMLDAIAEHLKEQNQVYVKMNHIKAPLDEFPGIRLLEMQHFKDLPSIKKPKKADPKVEPDIIKPAKGSNIYFTATGQKLCGVECADFLPNGDIITVQDDKLCVYDKDYKHKPVPFRISASGYIKNIKVHKVTSAVGLAMYGGNAKLVLPGEPSWSEIDFRIKEETIEFAHPTSDKGLIVISYNRQYYKPLERTLSKYSNSSMKIWQIFESYGITDVTITPDERIIACTWNKLHILDQDGKSLYHLPYPDQLRSYSFTPKCVCSDLFNNLYAMNSSDNNKLVMFDKNGNFVGKGSLENRVSVGSFNTMSVYGNSVLTVNKHSEMQVFRCTDEVPVPVDQKLPVEQMYSVRSIFIIFVIIFIVILIFLHFFLSRSI